MTPIPCARRPCPYHALVRCEQCRHAYCPLHYGAGSSSKCAACWHQAAKQGVPA